MRIYTLRWPFTRWVWKHRFTRTARPFTRAGVRIPFTRRGVFVQIGKTA